MKVIIAGSRTITDYQVLEQAIEESGFEITEVISGCAKGVDTLAIMYAKTNVLTLKLFPALWVEYGNRAGPIRNREMAEYGEALIAIWDGQSRGTKNMIKIANEKGLKVFVKELKLCGMCQQGDKPKLLDRNGVLSSISGEPGTWCHSYDIYWWGCTNPPKAW